MRTWPRCGSPNLVRATVCKSAVAGQPLAKDDRRGRAARSATRHSDEIAGAPRELWRRAGRRAAAAHRADRRRGHCGIPAHAAEPDCAGAAAARAAASPTPRRSAPMPSASAPRSWPTRPARRSASAARPMRGRAPRMPGPMRANPEFAAFYRSMQAYRNTLGRDGRYPGHRTGRRILQISAQRQRALSFTQGDTWGWTGPTCFAALAIVCIIEGIMPFLNPSGMKRLLSQHGGNGGA